LGRGDNWKVVMDDERNMEREWLGLSCGMVDEVYDEN
jgi:hypothetical protein